MQRKHWSLAIGLVAGLASGTCAWANPDGANVVRGQVSFARPDANTLNITNSPGAIINWQQFSIGSNETTRFIQPSSSSSVLNRVIGQNPSQLLGQLHSNGRVFLINPNGVIFGPNSVIDVASLITSTLNMTDADFMAGRYHFEGDEAGAIHNQGFIRSAPGGEIVFIAPSIENSGVIESPDGTLLLAAGSSVTLTSLDLEGVQFEIRAPEHQVLNLGELIASRGAAGVFVGTIRHSAVIEANTLSIDESGAVVLSALSDIHIESGGVIEASGGKGGEISIESEQGTTWVSGVVDASVSDGHGGYVEILGVRVAVIDRAMVDVSGHTGGGEILVGGDLRGENPSISNAASTVVGPQTRLIANAGAAGDGGKVIVWSDEMTKFAGRISATGGSLSGNGGFVETSGKAHLEATGMVDASAVTGIPGTWLLDPFDTDLTNAATSGGAFSGGNPDIFTPISDDAVVSIAEIVTSLEGGTRVEVNTGNGGVQAGDITVVNTITANLTSGDVSLTLSAANDLDINAAITATGANALTLNLVADNDLDTAGDITIGANINTNGGLVDAVSAGSGDVNFSGSRTITSDFDVTKLTLASTQTFDGITNVTDVEQSATINIAGGQQMNLSGTMNWNLGNIAGGGTLNILSGATLNHVATSATQFLTGSTIDNGGTFNLNNIGNSFRISSGGIFNNQSGGVFNFQNDSDVIDGGAGSDFNNLGTVTKSGGAAESFFSVTFNNQDGGIVDGGTGNIGLNASGTHTGQFIGIGDVRFNVIQNMAPVSSLAGTIGLFGGLDTSNDPTLNGTINWFGGNLSGGGTLNIAAGGTVNHVATVGTQFLSATTIDNQGTFNLNNTGNSFRISSGGVFNNLAGGVFNFQNDSDVINGGGAGADFNNFGTVRKTGGVLESLFSIDFNNQDGGVVDGGTGNIALAATGTQTGEFIGIGDVRFTANQNMAAGSSIAGTVGLFANLDTTNNPTVTGTLNWFLGNVAGGGTLNVASGGTINHVATSGTQFLSNANIDNQGTFNLNNVGNSFRISSGGIFNNQAGGVFDFQNDSDVIHGGGGATFTNAGTVQKTGGGAGSQFGASINFVTNDGTVDARTGTIDATQLATNNGLLTTSAGAFIDTAANLTNTGTIAGNGTVIANVTNNAFAVIAPGESAGALTISGNLTLLTDGNLDIELNGTIPGVGGHDQLIVTGATTLGGNLNATLGFAVSNANTFDFLTSAGGTSATLTTSTCQLLTLISVVKVETRGARWGCLLDWWAAR